jgi:tetratricopeptide (TPR) repeat protein
MVGCCARRLSERFSFLTPVRLIIPAAVALWVVALGLETYDRNDTWRSEIRLWEDTVSKSPEKHRPWFNLGCAHYRQGQLNEAVGFMEKALEIAPGFIPAHNNLGTFLILLGNYQKALDASNVGLHYAPEHSNMLYNKGAALAGLGELERAAEVFERVVAQYPNDRLSYVALGQVYAGLGQSDRASWYFGQAGKIESATGSR